MTLIFVGLSQFLKKLSLCYIFIEAIGPLHSETVMHAIINAHNNILSMLIRKRDYIAFLFYLDL